jgi:hypothetical protein
MSNPLAGGGAKVATEMMKEVQSAMKQADVAQTKQPGQVDFNNVLGTQKVGAPQELGIQNPIHDVLRAATQAQRGPAVPAIGNSIDTKPIKSGLHQMMDQLADGQNKLEEIMKISLSGKNLSSSELLGLQAGVFRFTQELELTSKLIEKGTSSIKQTLNTQV